MAEPTQEFVEVHDPDGAKRRFPLQGGRLVIGRTAEADVRLEGSGVSRQHAEIFADPYGRWWVRDLKSRNGTLVNGETITEHLIGQGDTIQIDEFAITLNIPAAAPPRSKSKISTSITLSDIKPGSVQSLHDLEPPRIAKTHLSALTNFSTKLLATEPDDERLKLLCRLMVSKDFHGNTAVALRLAANRPENEALETLCEPESSHNWRSGELPYVSRTILRKVRETKAPVVASNMGTSPGAGVVEMSLAGSVAQISAIACPFHIEGSEIDLLYVTFPAEYGTGEWLALAALASEQYQQAQTAWVARRAAQAQALVEQELEHARAIQMRLVPSKVEIPGLDVALGFEPCRWVGGDYIDVIPTTDGRAFVIVADVCGKGLQAALITATLHAMLRTNATAGADLVDLMSRLNEYLVATLPEESFVTAIGMVIDLNTGQYHAINAGHPPAMVVDRDGQIRELQTGQNLPLGYMVVPLEGQEGRLEPGQLLALYTDGLSEMTDAAGVMMGTDKLGQMVQSACASNEAAPIMEISGRLKNQLDAYLGNAMPQDDRTYLLLRRGTAAG